MPPQDQWSSPPPSTIQGVIDEMRGGRKIQAIKCLRTFSGLGLKESKDVCDLVQPRLFDRDSELTLFIEAEILSRHGTMPADHVHEPDWEAASETMWRLATALKDKPDDRFVIIESLAQEFDEIWGVT